MNLHNHLYAAFNVTGPVLLLLIAGIVFKRIRLVDEHFVAVGNKLVFNITLPCLLFLNVAKSSPAKSLNTPLIFYAVCATLVSVIIVWFISSTLVEKSKRGVFTQCAFRGNMAIVGLALAVNAFGDSIIAMAALYLAFLTVLYNILAVILLSRNFWGIIKNLFKNPLIISILIGAFWSYAVLPLPKVVETSFLILSKMTLPLALICIGASLEWNSFKQNHSEALLATLFKLIILPGVVVLIAIYLGYRGESLGVLFFMMSAPTAAAAFIMSKQMTPHGKMAAEIITISTALSPITVTVGLILLRYYGFVH